LILRLKTLYPAFEGREELNINVNKEEKRTAGKIILFYV
jgi:hypothetical protein